MILANLRERLTPSDLDLAVQLLARGDGAKRVALERALAAEGPDTVLDRPELAEALRRHREVGGPSPALFLYVTVRQALKTVGIDDPRVSDYLGALLLEFGLRRRAYRVSPHSEQEYHYLTDIMADLETVSGRTGFLLRVHLGNFSLWIAGVFPDYVTARRERRGGPDLSYYDSMGARGFRLASDHRLARELELDDLYAQVADSFAEIRVALNRLSDRLFFPSRSSPDRLMRQVADEFNLRQ
jgi:hypothetical protein